MACDAPCFSIVIGTFNAATTLQRTLDSVFHQSSPSWEVLVSDGASSDGTVEILRRNAASLAWWNSEPDSGLTQAWNRCLERIRGKWILFLGADDALFAKDTLQRAEERLGAISSTTLLAFGRILLAPAADLSRGTVLGSPWSQAGDRFFLENTLPHQAVFHNALLFRELGGFDESFRMAADYELMLRCVMRELPVDLGADLVVSRMADEGMSSDPRRSWMVHREFRRARRKHGLPGSLGERVLQGRVALKRVLAHLLGPSYARWIGRPCLRKQSA
jgi:glycosyltransferase involved in cell wall biosynthesis